MKKLWITIATIALLPGLSTAEEKSRPMSEMHGNCSNYKTDLKQAFKIWNEPSVMISSAESKNLPFAKRLSLKLTKDSQLKFVHQPEKSFPVSGERYGGIFKFRSSTSRTIQVMAGSKLWFDVIDASSKKPLASSEFEMQTGCHTIFKTVSFPVDTNTEYFLQVSSSSKNTSDFLIVNFN